jgi:hypothetical protein
MKEKFERIIQTRPPFDKRNPEPSKNYGIGALQLWFILKGKKGAVTIHLGTELYLAKQLKEWKETNNPYPFSNKESITCWDVGYHSPKKMYKEQTICMNKCEWLNGKPCYYDGSSLRGEYDKVVENYLEYGDEWIWEYLEKYYRGLFK